MYSSSCCNVSTQLVCALSVAPQRSRWGMCSTVHDAVAPLSSASTASLPISFQRMSSISSGSVRPASDAASLCASLLPQQLPKMRRSLSWHAGDARASHRASTATDVYSPRPFQLTPHLCVCMRACVSVCMRMRVLSRGGAMLEPPSTYSWFWPSLSERRGLSSVLSHRQSTATACRTNDRTGPRAREHQGRTGPRAGEYLGRIGPRAGGFYQAPRTSIEYLPSPSAVSPQI